MIKKIFSLFAAILFAGSMMADPAAAGTTLFSEDFSSYSKDDVPSGSVTTATGRVVYGDANVTYSCTDGNGTKPGATKIYNESTGGGTAPEILVGKYGNGGSTGGSFTIAGIPSGGAQEITVSYTQNKQKLKVAVSGTGYTSDGYDAKPDNVGTVSFDITVSDGADDTFTLTFSAYSSNVRVDDILVTVKTAGEGGAPAPTLESVAVSGTPTKTSYYAGDNFDPAGLTVTGHYSDNTDAPITSGITWAYNPSQTLALNQTSIGVTATVSEIASAEYNVTGLTVTEAPAAENYELVVDASNLADGDEIIIVNEDEDYAMGSQNSSNRAAVAVSATNHIITPGENVQIIVLEASSTNWKFKVGEDSYLYASSNSSNQLKTTTSSSAGDNGVWAITIANDGTATAIAQGSNGRNDMRYNPNNGSPLFSCYASSSTMAKVKIYKKAGEPSADPSISASNIALGTEWIKSTETFKKEVELIVAGANLTEGITVESSNPTEVAVSTTSLSAEGGTVTVTIETGIGELNETITLTSGSTSKVVAVTGTIKEIKQYEVAEAIFYAGEKDINENDVIEVRGIVTNIQLKGASFTNYGSAIFYVEDATGEAGEFEFYNCLSYGEEKFTSTTPDYDPESSAYASFTDIHMGDLTFSVGDEVIARGQYTKYNNTTYELKTDCYLVYAKASGASWPTSVDNTVDGKKAVKFIENGQLFIELNGHIYNVQGQTVK